MSNQRTGKYYELTNKERFWRERKLKAVQSRAEKKEKEMLAKTSLKDLIK